MRVSTLLPYLATSRKFCRLRKIPDVTSSRVVGYCVGSAILAPLFLVVIATAAMLITVFVVAAVVVFLLVAIVAIVSPPIVVFGGALLRVGIFCRSRFLLLVSSLIFRCIMNHSVSTPADNTRRRTAARFLTGSDSSVESGPLDATLVQWPNPKRYLRTGVPDPLTTASCSSIEGTTGSGPFRFLGDHFVSGDVLRT